MVGAAQSLGLEQCLGGADAELGREVFILRGVSGLSEGTGQNLEVGSCWVGALLVTVGAEKPHCSLHGVPW